MTVSLFSNNSLSPLGDAAVRIDCGAANDPATSTLVAQVAAKLSLDWCIGVTDVVPAYGVVAVIYDPIELFAAGIESPLRYVCDWITARTANVEKVSEADIRDVEIPVVYGGEFGPDIELVAKHSQLSVEEVIRRHLESTYHVRAIGFTPGFPYLNGLQKELATPRRSTPRTAIPAGSVGIGGSQTGVYPLASPGGWNLIGRTPLKLFSPMSSPAALLRVGDTVRFRQIDQAEFEALNEKLEQESKRDAASSSSEPQFEVLHPGLQTTIQDLGRPGHQAEGVSPGGAMDALAARVANLIVGNDEGAPLLEAVQVGPKLRVLCDVTIAITGAAVDGIPGGRPIQCKKGHVINCSKIEGAGRCYVAAAGGFAADFIFDGCGTDLNAGFGGINGRALAVGDQLCSAELSQSSVAVGEKAHWFVSPPSLVPAESEGRLRIVRGPQADWFSDAAWSKLFNETFTVSPQSNRMGIRLQGFSMRRR